MHSSRLSTLLLCLFSTLCLAPALYAGGVARGITQSDTVTSNSSPAEHVYGLPGARPKDKGALRATATDLVFIGKTSRSTIPLQSIIAANAGNERVELWGMKGRILRMAIPNGGGLLAATFMHHRVDMLTVEFSDEGGAYHSAVFFLSGDAAERILQIVSRQPVSRREPAGNVCEDNRIAPGTVRVPIPTGDETGVPAAYRALVYERLIEGLDTSKSINHVYRDGESDAARGCPQYTMQISLAGFKQGSQVGRASMGPVGFFVGTTQMVVELSIIDAEGREKSHEQIKATVRGESESMNVAGSVAKKLTRQFSDFQKDVNKANLAKTTFQPYSR